MKKRGFEIVQKYINENLELPKRETNNAAGYDIKAAEDFVVPSIWKFSFLKALWQIKNSKELTNDELISANKVLKPFLVPTGIKAYMDENEFLMIANRSSNPLKRNLILPNGVGIIDADYYNNKNNEGAIFVQMTNVGLTDLHIKKGERIAQGIFISFLTTDDDSGVKKKTRNGGFGSSGIK